MIKSVQFKKNFRSFSEGDKFTFKPGVNVLVGDQGSGKSTLIELIRSKIEGPYRMSDSDSTYRAKTIESSQKIDDLIEVETDPHTKCLAYDFERESARDMSALHFDMMSEQLAAMKSSHGQGNFISLNRILGNILKNKDTVDLIMLDEPDAAMSPRSCYKLLEILRSLDVKWKKQIILSAHNPIIINGVHPLMKGEVWWKEVLSLEDKMWIDANVFMVWQLLEKPNEKTKKENA